ncbi:hypothetical protein OAF54_03355 [bacterium]|nr:hypothetical protein [bacterium]
MEPYLLTQEDIDKLVAAGRPGAMEGETATPEDLQVLGVTPQDTPEAPAITDDRSPGGITVDDAPVASNANVLQQLLAQQAALATPTDPYANLSKNQRRMLAFSALEDAGASLAGRQGGSFNAMLGRFNEQADIQRKATAAQAQRQMLQGLVGGGVGADPQARIQQLLDIAMVNPQLAPAIALQVKQIQDQVKASTGDVSGSSQAATQLEDVNALINMIDEDPSLTTGIMGSLLSYIPGTGANIAEGLATTLRSNLALQALKDLKATGATMGALNATEFTALETELTQLDLSKGPQTSKRALKRIQTKYQNLVADAYRAAEEQVAAGNPIGQRTLDGLNRIFGGKPAWTENAGPVVPSGGSTDPLNIL